MSNDDDDQTPPPMDFTQGLLLPGPPSTLVGFNTLQVINRRLKKNLPPVIMNIIGYFMSNPLVIKTPFYSCSTAFSRTQSQTSKYGCRE